jgi:hypothetical protein
VEVEQHALDRYRAREGMWCHRVTFARDPPTRQARPGERWDQRNQKEDCGIALRVYLIGEVTQDYADGLLTRREAMRRLGLPR